MDSEIIKNNEAGNDGSKIHLYYNSGLNSWFAYGLSAYFLRLYGKEHALRNCFRSFSDELSLPYTVVDNDAVKHLLSSSLVELKEQKDYIYVRLDSVVSADSYKKWVLKLRGAQGSSDMDVETPVSKYVSKDEYIKDNMTSFSRKAKRLIDLILSSIALVVFSPLILIVAIFVKAEDGGASIYKQERIGRFGRPFYIYKFRSMRLDAEKMGPQLSSCGGDGDPRLTKVGRFIRAHHLDELPQLWNVFKGDMAFIGPRPERRFFIDQILEHDPRYVFLYQIRPGVTSYATLYNGYTDTMEKMLRRLEYDLYYLGHRSFFLDMRILFNTFCSIIFGKKF